MHASEFPSLTSESACLAIGYCECIQPSARGDEIGWESDLEAHA